VKKKGAKIHKKESIFIKEFLIREAACLRSLAVSSIIRQGGGDSNIRKSPLD
jgi:hypothetical protein